MDTGLKAHETAEALPGEFRHLTVTDTQRGSRGSPGHWQYSSPMYRTGGTTDYFWSKCTNNDRAIF